MKTLARQILQAWSHVRREKLTKLSKKREFCEKIDAVRKSGARLEKMNALDKNMVRGLVLGNGSTLSQVKSSRKVVRKPKVEDPRIHRLDFSDSEEEEETQNKKGKKVSRSQNANRATQETSSLQIHVHGEPEVVDLRSAASRAKEEVKELIPASQICATGMEYRNAVRRKLVDVICARAFEPQI
jgi:hypothetical protein